MERRLILSASIGERRCPPGPTKSGLSQFGNLPLELSNKAQDFNDSF